MKKYILLISLFVVSAQALDSAYREFGNDSSYLIERLINKKIKHQFSKNPLGFADFDSVKNYIKANPSWKERGDGTYSIQYHCRFPGCTKISIGNISDAASCFLNHYRADFFSCQCGRKYKIFVTLLAHAKSCASLTDTMSDEISDSGDWEIAESETHHNQKSDDDSYDFDLGMLQEEDRVDTSLLCTETLEPIGVDPKLIFTHLQCTKLTP